jgi:hypothetical protein
MQRKNDIGTFGRILIILGNIFFALIIIGILFVELIDWIAFRLSKKEVTVWQKEKKSE